MSQLNWTEIAFLRQQSQTQKNKKYFDSNHHDDKIAFWNMSHFSKISGTNYVTRRKKETKKNDANDRDDKIAFWNMPNFSKTTCHVLDENFKDKKREKHQNKTPPSRN